MKNIFFNAFIFFFILALDLKTTQAWIYPEHRDIALLAIQKLNKVDRLILDKLWSEARIGYEKRLTDSVIDVNQTTKPDKLDFASWAAISGDHSTSSEDLLNNVLKTDWILKVADIAAELKLNIANSEKRSQRINAIRDSDIKLQRADLEYASRAGTNNVHFLLARPEVDTDSKNYLIACLSKGSELNALSAYSWFHTSSLNKAARYSKEKLSPEQKSALILAALADESFALHFLEDVFAAGHIAGTWGKTPVRKGTHDFYNENGLDVVTWDDKRMIVMGDAYMRPEDAEIISVVVKLSLEQIINAATGQIQIDYSADTLSGLNLPDTFNVGKNNFTLPRQYNIKLIGDVLVKTPVPGMASGKGELPRFRSELGPFLGASAAINGSMLNGGFAKDQTKKGLTGGIEANIRIGLGIDGVLNEAGDGLVFIQVGRKEDATSSNQFTDNEFSVPAGTITAAIPARSSYTFRVRMPFCLIPGDLIIAAPLLLISPETYTKMAITSGNGGLIPWQSGIATGIGRFQFILGREMGVTFYGLQTPKDVLLIPTSSTTAQILEYKSTQFDFPFLEYRPFRTFSMDQSSSLIVQFTVGFDVPRSTSVLYPADSPAQELKTVWYVGSRIVFDWRHYFK